MSKTLIRKGLFSAFFFMIISSLLIAQAQESIKIANNYLFNNLKNLRLSESDISEFKINDLYITKHNKLTHLYLIQQHNGIDVFNAMINMNIKENGEVLSIGNRFIPGLAKRANTSQPTITMEEAVESFLKQFKIPYAGNILFEEKGENAAVVNPAGMAQRPVKVNLIYQPMPNKEVRLAWNVELLQLDGRHWWNARIDALNGDLLNYFDQIISCEFGNHGDICEDDIAHKHTLQNSMLKGNGLSNNTSNVYNVFPLTIESPNHGSRSLEVNPAHPNASPFGWHDTDGIEGPEFTITRGNNVHAFQNIFNIGTSTGDEPDGGDSLVFDFPLDLSTNRPYTQLLPAVTNLFYWNNLMHDVWYEYGFDEASGNFQENNYGNGGQGSDYVVAFALDGSGTNNATFGTPTDGGNPAMSMFLWGGQLPDLDAFEMEIIAPDSLAGMYLYSPASFGGELPAIDMPLEQEVVLVEDEGGVLSDACEEILNGADIAGKIAMIDRGSCEFGFKVLAAENAGAVAVIICNNDAGPPATISMGPGDVGNQATIPAIMLSLADCNTLKAGLPGLRASLKEPEFEVPTPGPTGRDSDFDNGIIAHEYTHGISIRLTGGPNNSSCLNTFEQAGEGWSDWYGLVMTTTPDMTAEQPRGIGTFAINQPITGDGIRTYPYTRDMNINPHTYAAIESAAVPHGVGSVWCAMIWDLFWNLVDEHGYDEDLYNGTGGNNIAMQLVTDGLKLQPCSPSFVDARDAILEADSVNNDGANACIIWETFARRGLGFSAQAGGLEAFDIPDACNFTFRVNKTSVTEADAGETITYDLEITNGRREAIENAAVRDQLPEGTTLVGGSSNCDVSVEDGVLTISLGTMESGATVNCSYELRIADTPFSFSLFEDDAEDDLDNFIVETPVGFETWTTTSIESFSGETSFFAPDVEPQHDQILTLRDPITLDGDQPTLSFWHWYNTEAEWDGGVVEISVGGGAWQDLGPNMTQNGYNARIRENPASAISNRLAFTGNSGEWIQTIVDLGPFKGETVQIRYRMVCDEFVGGEGWYVDDIQIFGDFHAITNTACVDDNGELRCSAVTTTIFGDIVNSTNNQFEAFGVDLFPNPTEDKFTISFENPNLEVMDMSVLSVDGQLLFNRRFNGTNNEEIDMTPYGAGVYVVQLKGEKGIVTRRLIVN